MTALEVLGRVSLGDSLLSLSEFLPRIADEESLSALTEDILDLALEDVRKHEVSVPITVNIPPQIVTIQLPARIEAVLRTWGLPNEQLALEITEDALLIDVDSAREALDELRGNGHRILLDDFGTGYSGLAALRDLPIDTIKIDQSFISRLAYDPSTRRLVHHLICMAHDLGVDVVAEGVEDAETWEHVIALGVNAVQGFYVCPPQQLNRSYADWPLLHRLSQ